MAVFQQVILDKINATPYPNIPAAFTREDANKGRPVLLSGAQPQNINKNALGALTATPSSLGFKISGIFGDWHHDKLISVFRKGRVVVNASSRFTDSDIGKKILHNAGGIDFVATDSDPLAVGEILDGGIHDEIGHFYYVDINFPEL